MENDNFQLNDDVIWIKEDMKTALQNVYDNYRRVLKQNDVLRKENEKIKSEAYKDEELSRLKSEYDKMKLDYNRGFPVTQEQGEKIHKWAKKIIEKYPANTGAIGGRFVYEFVPTGVGTTGTIIDSFSNEKFEFMELS